MKKMMLVAAACAMVAAPSALFAQDDPVTSVNVVGYYSVTIPNNGIALVTPVLDNMEGATLQELVGNQLPGGSEAFIWDRVNKGYIPATLSRGNWTATNVILRGDAIWLRPSANSGPQTVTFMGEVPSENNNASTTTVHNISGIDAVGYAYPVDKVWTETSLAAAVPNASELLVWNIETQGYETFTKSRGAWTTPAGYEIKAGQGFWIRTADPVDWVEGIPYDL